MRSYLSLVPISAKVHKRKNKMILTCIILAVFLVTVIFSMADMGIRMEKIRANYYHGNWHILLKNMPKSDAEKIADRKEVSKTAWYDYINEDLSGDYYVCGKKTLVCGIDENYTDIYSGFSKNAYPQSDNEVILSGNMKNLMDIGVGDTIALSTPTKDYNFTVSGFYDNSGSLTANDAVGVFVTIPKFEEIRTQNGETGDPCYHIQFKKYVNARKTIDNIKNEFALTDENLVENEMILMLSGFSANSTVFGFYCVAAVLFLLILAAAVLMISGSINTSVAERTQFFGMLRCTGASKKQIKRLVKLEALNWCRTSIPIGVITGIIITWGLCATLHYIVGGEFAEIPVFGVSPIGIVCGIIVGLLTVLLAARAPAKRASRVSPIAAASGSSEKYKKISRAANIHFGRIETSLGISHALSEKKSLVLMTLSFALGIILFLCFSTTLDLVERGLMPVRPYSPDVSFYSDGYSNTIDKALVDKIADAPNVKKAFGRMYKGDVDAISNKNVSKVDLISYEKYQFEWAEEDLLRGDLSKVADGNYAITDFSKTNPLDVGDKLIINGQETEIAAVLSSTPFSSDETPMIICSEQTFSKLVGESNYSIVDVQFTQNATRSDIENIRLLAGEEYIFSDRWELNKDNVRLYIAFRLFVYGFLAIIALIAVVNIINSISMSVAAKLKQYGIMRAVGMSTGQIIKMIAAEAVTYSVFGIVVGLGIGLPLHKWCYELLLTTHFGIAWQIPIVLIAIIVLIIAITTIAAIYFPAKLIKRMSITATINEQ